MAMMAVALTSDRMWRLRPEAYPILKKAASILRRQKSRHSGAAQAVEFIDALMETQKKIDRCWGTDRKNPIAKIPGTKFVLRPHRS